jgi:homopolymeric O-antigen transport system permease protein
MPVMVKALPWAFIVASIRFGTVSLSTNANLVTKIAFPRAVFPLAAILSQLVDFAVATALLVVIFIFVPTGASLQLLWVPLLLVILLVQIAGLTLLLSAANLFFRDVKYLVEVVLTFAIFFTPVFYETEMFGHFGRILLLNPVAPILEGLSSAVVFHRAPDPGWTLYSAGVALVLALAAPAFFHRLEPKFAESI